MRFTKLQQDQIKSSLCYLSSVCDGEIEDDGHGFNGADSGFGKSLAAQIEERGFLSGKQYCAAVKMLQKYRNQLEGAGFDIPAIKDIQGKDDAQGKTQLSVNEPDVTLGHNADLNVITVKFRNSRAVIDEMKPKVKAIPYRSRSFDFDSMQWRVSVEFAQAMIDAFPDAVGVDTIKDLVNNSPQEEAGTEPARTPDLMTIRIVKDKIVMQSPYYREDWVRLCQSIEEGRFRKSDKAWIFGLNKAQAILDAAKSCPDILDIDPSIGHFVESLSKRASLSRVHDAPLVDDLPIPEGLSPLPYQSAGYNFMKAAGFRCVLADGMGLGKTIQAILVVMSVKEEGPVIVSCPASVKLNWERELKKWIPGIRVRVLNGRTPKDAIDPGEHDVFIINHDILGTRDRTPKDGGIRLGKFVYRGWFEQFLAVRPSLIVFDEGHKVGNGSSIRGKLAQTLAKECDRVIILTGTPIQNRPRELFPLLNMVDPGSWSNFFKFATRYCDAQHNGYGWDFNGASNLDELHEKIKPWVLRRTKDQVLKELPSKRRVDLLLDLPRKDRKAYDAMVNECANKIASGELESGEHLAYMGRFRQLAADAKVKHGIEWLLDFCESGDKIIVFAVHKKVIRAVEDAMNKAKIGNVKITGETPEGKRQEAVDRFQNDPDCLVFLGNIQAAGEGITLTAASDVLFLEFAWKPGEHHQAEDRAHRIGQESNVTVWYSIANKTIDTTLFGIIDGKRRVIENVLEGSVSGHKSKVLKIDADSGTRAEGLDLVSEIAASLFSGRGLK